MREDTSDLGVELRSITTRERSPDDDYDVLLVAVPTANPQSSSRDSHVDEDADVIVGELPITNAEIPCVERHVNAEFVTVLDERVCAYYPVDDGWAAALTWDAANDEWNCDRWELETYSFDPEDVALDDEESIVWRRVNDETAIG